MKQILTFIFLILCSFALYADPFGLEFGMSLEDLLASEDIVVIDPPLDEISTDLITMLDIIPPEISPLFDAYLVSLLDNIGLYEIRASKKGGRSHFDRVYNALRIKYGETDPSYDDDEKRWEASDRTDYTDITLRLVNKLTRDPYVLLTYDKYDRLRALEDSALL